MQQLSRRRASDVWAQPAELWLIAAALLGFVAVSLFMSLLIGRVHQTDVALSAIRDLEEPPLAISALTNDHSRAGVEVLREGIARARRDQEKIEPAVTGVLGATGARLTARLTGGLDSIAEGVGEEQDDVQLSVLLLAYHTDLRALSSELTLAHMSAMTRLERGLRTGAGLILGGSLAAALAVLSTARRYARRKVIETERAASEVAAVADAASVAIIVVDRSGDIPFANLAAERLFGYERNGLTGQPVLRVLPGAGTLPVGEVAGPQLSGLRTDGSVFPAELSVTAAPAPDGEPRFVYVIQDVSERIHAEEERLQFQERLLIAQRNDALATLVAGVAHDFNNLITAIRASVEMAQQSPDRGGEWLQHAIVAADRSAGLVAQLLQYARPAPPEETDVDVTALVSESVELARQTFDRRVELCWDPPSVGPIVRGDRDQLQQVVMNLLVNARDAVMERVDGTDPAYQPRVSVRVGARPGEAVGTLEVVDNGAGIRDAVRTRIFDPFFTTKQRGKGTGLGLSTSARIVATHNGKIEVTSRLHAGTSFVVTLPASGVAPPSIGITCPGQSVLPPAASPGLRVLLADDEPVIREFASVVLRKAGYQVVAVGDGLAAVREGTAGAFDLLVMDGNMPYLSGWEAARQLRSIHSRIPVVMMTGYVEPEQADEIDVIILQKPFGLDQFRKTMAAALHRADA